MAPPRKNGVLVAVVLVVDLALAAAGAVMLVKGLTKPKAAAANVHGEAAPAPTPVAAVPAAPATATVPSATATPTAAAPAPPAAEPVETKPEKTVKKDAKHTDKKAGGKTTAPLDPYTGAAPPPSAAGPAADQSQDIERQAAQSFGSFRVCHENALQAGPIHGDIKIAFQIQPDGHVDHAHAVVNTTHSDALAQCLEQTIATWTFAPHSGPAASYERPFSYP